MRLAIANQRATFCTVTAAGQTDTVLRLIEMRIAEIWSWGHAAARPEPRHIR